MPIDLHQVMAAAGRARLIAEAGRIQGLKRCWRSRNRRRRTEKARLRARVRIVTALLLQSRQFVVLSGLRADADADAYGEQHGRDEHGKKDSKGLKRKDLNV